MHLALFISIVLEYISEPKGQRSFFDSCLHDYWRVRWTRHSPPLSNFCEKLKLESAVGSREWKIKVDHKRRKHIRLDETLLNLDISEMTDCRTKLSRTLVDIHLENGVGEEGLIALLKMAIRDVEDGFIGSLKQKKSL